MDSVFIVKWEVRGIHAGAATSFMAPPILIKNAMYFKHDSDAASYLDELKKAVKLLGIDHLFVAHVVEQVLE